MLNFEQLRDQKVYYLTSNNLFQCFLNGTRELIQANISSLLTENQQNDDSVKVISDVQLCHFLSSVQNRSQCYINRKSVDLYFIYGLICEDEYLQFCRYERELKEAAELI